MILFDYLKYSLFLVFIVFLPGKYLIHLLKVKLPIFDTVLIGTILGLWAITIEAYIIGVLGLKPILVYFLILQSIILLVVTTKFVKPDIDFKDVKINFLAVSVIVLSVLVNSWITFQFGTVTDKGIKFAGAHDADNNWHLALINNLQKEIPPELPVYAGMSLKNYHYLVDLQIAVTQLFTHISLPELFYQIKGPFYIFLYSALAYLVGKVLTGRCFGGVLVVIYTALSSNWYYLAKIFYPNSYNWPSVAWVDYFSSKSVNYPLLFSMIMLFTVIYLFSYIKNKNLNFIVILSIFIGSLMAIKSHTGIIVISSLAILGLIQLVKKDSTFFKIFSGSMFVGVFFSLLMIDFGRSGLIVDPFWFIKVMYEASDRLNFDTWELKRQYLLSVNSYLGIAKLYIQGIAIFLLINLNILLVGSLSLLNKTNKWMQSLAYFLVIVASTSFLATMIFIYKGLAIITIQFFYPAIIALSILISILIINFYNKHKYPAIIFGLLVWLSLLPGVIFTLGQYSNRNSGYVSKSINEAMNFLSAKEDGVILNDLRFSINSMISAYTKKTAFYSDELTLDSLSINYSKRKTDVVAFFRCRNPQEMRRFMFTNNIKYIFVGKDSCVIKLGIFNEIFSNNEVVILTSF